MRIAARTIPEYFEAVEPRRRADLEAVDGAIVAAAPTLSRWLFVGPSITMLGYGELDWVGASGSGVWPLIGLASQKRYLSVYVAAERDGVTLAEYYRDRLGKTDNGRSCIRFRRASDIDLDVLAQAVRDAVSW
jgi:hypothetical protein